ncbi:unnamed protein product [Cylicostephanus goldi]|uniref:Potassium channel tetramerisation-type BTB domain-containing protein n=1 Tax=Cylicostephanus goldi TaxID=71465 RepID=A0A3P6SA05_CYLGO|nr:unnamed protein product [Cylicostephanus goldi]
MSISGAYGSYGGPPDVPKSFTRQAMIDLLKTILLAKKSRNIALQNMEEANAMCGIDLVYLNVGGKKYTTNFETLARSKSSYFNELMKIDRNSGRVLLFLKNCAIDREGALFINRDGDLFAHALQFMRDGRRAVLPEDKCTLKQLIVSIN